MYDIIRHTKNNEGCSYMKKLVNKLLEKYKMLNKWEKKVLIWYVISITLIVIENLSKKSDYPLKHCIYRIF